MPNLSDLQGEYVNRMPDAGRIAAAFNKKAVEYDQHVLVQNRVVECLVGSVGQHQLQTPSHILDVGTGTGTLLERLHERYPDALLTGVDIALNMCLRTLQKLGSCCNTVNGDAENLPFRTGAFDLVVSASALQWVGNLAAALHEMLRVMRPGGEISIAFFCHGSLGELQHCFRDAISRRTPDNDQRMSRLHGFRTAARVPWLLARAHLARHRTAVAPRWRDAKVS